MGKTARPQEGAANGGRKSPSRAQKRTSSVIIGPVEDSRSRCPSSKWQSIGEVRSMKGFNKMIFSSTLNEDGTGPSTKHVEEGTRQRGHMRVEFKNL